MSTKQKKITWGTALSFGLPDLMGSGGFTILGVYFMFFLTTFADIPAWEVGLIIAIARIVDAFVCLFVGPLTDNFYRFSAGRRFGRRRFFILFGAPLTLVYILLWVVVPGNFFYYLAVYLSFEILAAFLMIPWETLPSEMTTDYVERTKLSTTRMTISAGAAFLATFIPSRIISFIGDQDPKAYLVNGAVWAVLFVLIWLLCWKNTWERDPEQVMKARKERNKLKENLESDNIGKGSLYIDHVINLLMDYVSTLRVRAFRKHLYVYLLSFTGKDFHNAIFAYFIVYSFGLNASLTGDLLSMSIIGIPACILAGFLMVKWGPKWLLTYAYSIMLVMLATYWIVYQIRPSNLVLTLFVISTIYQIGRATLEFTPWNVFPFIPDIDELLTRKRREGLFAAVMTFARKTTLGIAFIALGFILESVGFQAGTGVEQSQQTLDGIVYALIFGTGGLVLLALLVGLTFKLNRRTHSIIIKEIERLKSGGKKEDVDPEVKKICEQLVGVKYENMWE
ncbi:MAG: MFS transporter [Alphaproteobacteria bacterium]|jgi:oligogalacturonide transporter|nr:MFS transporter [Alphaproteobacteria bacterium]